MIFIIKEKKFKEIVGFVVIIVYMGIIEFILYGVNFLKCYFLIVLFIGGGFGGFYVGIMNVYCFVVGFFGLLGLFFYISYILIYFFIIMFIVVIIIVSIIVILIFILV